MYCRPDQIYYNSIIDAWMCNGKVVSEELVEVARLVMDLVEKLKLPRDYYYNKFAEQCDVIEYLIDNRRNRPLSIIALGFITANTREITLKQVSIKLNIKLRKILASYKYYVKGLAVTEKLPKVVIHRSQAHG